MLLATGFLSGPYGLEIVLWVVVPPVLAVVLALACAWLLRSRRERRRWAAGGGLVLPLTWTLLGALVHAVQPQGAAGQVVERLGLAWVAVLATLAGVPLGSATTYAVSRLLSRAPRTTAREVLDASVVALLPALVAWATLRFLGALPQAPSPHLLVRPALAALGGLWGAAAMWLLWARLNLLPAPPLSVASDPD